jgi:xanthine dehydrogenase accessory factor
MTELFDHIEQLKDKEGKVALATLVNTKGTTPRKEGAKMLVGEGGRVLGSVTIGGCVDAQVIEESADVLGQNLPRLLELNLGDEEAWEIGLTCGGTIEVFVEPVRLDQPGDQTLAYYERARARAETGGRAAIVTRLDAPHNGAKLLVLDAGGGPGTELVTGTLGDQFLDKRFAIEAETVMRGGTSRTLFLEGVRAFVEVFAPPAILLVVGASHVAMPLTTLARTLGFRTVVIDGRPRFATRERFPDVDDLKIGIPSDLVQTVPLIPTTALVLVAHDYKYDIPVMRHALATTVGYVGLLGSMRRGAAIFNLLREDGVPEEQLARVRTPIGLDLGAQSAPEIALAIMAEILAVQRGATGLPISEKVKRGIPSATGKSGGAAKQ